MRDLFADLTDVTLAAEDTPAPAPKRSITGQYGATFSHKISPWSYMVLKLYLVAKHNTSIYPGIQGKLGWVTMARL